MRKYDRKKDIENVKTGLRKLTKEDVLQIRELIHHKSYTEVAKMFSVHKNTIVNIITGKTYYFWK